LTALTAIDFCLSEVFVTKESDCEVFINHLAPQTCHGLLSFAAALLKVSSHQQWFNHWMLASCYAGLLQVGIPTRLHCPKQPGDE